MPSDPQRHAPAKPFRDEARTGSVKCLACGGPISLHGFGGVRQVSCPYCGSELSPDDSGALRLLQKVQRQRRQSVLPLHVRGTLDGVEWEILGVIWRSCRVDGDTYPWQELILFNPYHGYRWLIYAMDTGRWNLGEPLDGAPITGNNSWLGPSIQSLYFAGIRYRHFQTVQADTDYVEGEFPWQVRAGDTAAAHEFVAPPRAISIEEAQTEHGADVTFTRMRYIPARQVWKAFAQEGAPPREIGVSSTMPNPYRAQARSYWRSAALFLVLWAALSAWYVGSRENKAVAQEQGLPIEPYIQEISLGPADQVANLEFFFTAKPLSNSWAFAEVMLIPKAGGEALGFSVEVDEWHGVSGGESWKEGNPRRTIEIGGVPGGDYTLQILPQAAKDRATGSLKVDSIAYAINRDVPLWRYVFLPLLPILFFPLFNTLRALQFEGKRWQESDHPPSSD